MTLDYIFFTIGCLVMLMIISTKAFPSTVESTVSAEVVSIETWCSTNPEHTACTELFNEGFITYSSNGNATWNAP